MTDKPTRPPETPRSLTGHHIDLAFEEMASPGRIVHDFRVQAQTEWDVLVVLGTYLRDGSGTLRKLKVSRFGAEPVCVAFQCAGLRMPDARELMGCLKAESRIHDVRLEYVLMTRAEPSSQPKV